MVDNTADFITEDDLKYTFNSIPNGSIAFSVKASNDAHIALTSGPNVTEPIVEIFIGGWGNKKSAIRRNRQSSNEVSVDTPNILGRCQPKGFWIRWTGGHIEVGKSCENQPFMAWTDPEPFPIRYFGVCTGWGACGNWTIENVSGGRCGRGICTGNDLKYQFYSVSAGSFSFKVQASNDAHIALSPTPGICFPITEIFLGGWKNTKSAIRYNRQGPEKTMVDTPNILNSSEYRGFWVRWNGGQLSVGKEGEEGSPIMSWVNCEPFNIKYFGICTGWGSTGSWKLYNIKPETNDGELSTGNDLKYVFYPASNRRVTFKVKAANDAHVALSKTPGISMPMIEIFIGGWRNTQSAIRRDRSGPEKVLVQTPNILSKDEYRGFWVEWTENYVSVGKEGESAPFISWNDPEALEFEYFGVCTGWGATGSWKFSDEEGPDIDIR